MIASSLVFYALHMRRMKGVITVDPFTKEYNKTESPIERRLFKSLWALNYPVVCQYPFGRYRLDMALPFLKLCIEADGKDYHSSPSRKAHDRKRDAYLKSRGWTTLRFSGSQINSNINWVVRRIEKEIEKRKTHLN
jgi:very-short-patch-repair endonuclease